MASLAMVRGPRGKLTFKRDPITRDFVRDDRGVYAVLATVAMRKGAYYFDRTGQAGTLLYTVKNDRLTTGSRLTAFAADGLKQVENASLGISQGAAQASKGRTGSWRLQLSWHSPAGPQTELLEL